MTMRAKIVSLKKQGYRRDAAYQIIAGEMALFAFAFFGHKFTDQERNRKAAKKLSYVWNLILSENL